MRYDWKNTETNEIVEHDHPSDPPNLPGEWQRIFSFGTGRVEGGGGSPSRPSVKKSIPGNMSATVSRAG